MDPTKVLSNSHTMEEAARGLSREGPQDHGHGCSVSHGPGESRGTQGGEVSPEGGS